MNLFDRFKLLLRSTAGSALDISLPDLAPGESSLKMLDKAQARIEMLKDDMTRAQKRGDTELAARLKREMEDLQRTVDKARRSLGQRVPAQSVASQAPQPAEATSAPAQSIAQQDESPVVQHDRDESLDSSRVADQIRKAREGN